MKQQQNMWDKPHIEATQQGLLNSAVDTRARARLLAVQAKESGEWLNALPVPSLGLRFDDEVVRIAAGLRLGVPLCRPHPCSQCGGQVDELGTHGLSCRLSAGRLPWHAAINTIVKMSLADPIYTGALRPQPVRWQTSRWGYHHSMASRSHPCLGRDMPGHICSFSYHFGNERDGGGGCCSRGEEDHEVWRAG